MALATYTQLDLIWENELSTDAKEALLDVASAVVSDYTNVQWEVDTSRTDILSGTGLPVLPMPARATTITSITFNPTATQPTVVDVSEVLIDADTGSLYWKDTAAYSSWPLGWKNIEVEYDTSAAIPVVIVHATCQVATELAHQLDADVLVTEKSVRDIKIKYDSVSTGALITPSIEALLQPYKRLVVL